VHLVVAVIIDAQRISIYRRCRCWPDGGGGQAEPLVCASA
jgi:hypothetical protein